LPALAEAAKKTAEDHSRIHVEARERFIEDKDLRVVEQRCDDENFLAHPFGIAGEGGVAVFPETRKAEKLVRFVFEEEPAQSAETPDELEMLASAEVRIEVRLLGYVADAALKGFAGFGIFMDVMTIQRDFAGCGLEQPDDHLDCGAFTGTVWPEIAERFAAMNHETNLVDDWDAGVPFGEAANFEHRLLDTPFAFNAVYYIVFEVKRLAIGLVLTTVFTENDSQNLA